MSWYHAIVEEADRLDVSLPNAPYRAMGTVHWTTIDGSRSASIQMPRRQSKRPVTVTFWSEDSDENGNSLVYYRRSEHVVPEPDRVRAIVDALKAWLVDGADISRIKEIAGDGKSADFRADTGFNAGNRTAFQAWLRRYLSDTGMTNVQCGERFGVNDSLIGHYLRGTRFPTYMTLQKIKKATGTNMNELFE